MDMTTPVQSDQAHRTTVVAASPELCYQVVADIAKYPEWVQEISNVEIVSSNAGGQVTEATFTAESFGRSTTYTLAYDYSESPSKLSWTLVESDIVSELAGSYEFSALEGAETQVNYFVSVKVAVPLPGFIKRRAEDKLISSALADFKAYVEAKS